MALRHYGLFALDGEVVRIAVRLGANAETAEALGGREFAWVLSGGDGTTLAEAEATVVDDPTYGWLAIAKFDAEVNTDILGAALSAEVSHDFVEIVAGGYGDALLNGPYWVHKGPDLGGQLGDAPAPARLYSILPSGSAIFEGLISIEDTSGDDFSLLLEDGTHLLLESGGLLLISPGRPIAFLLETGDFLLDEDGAQLLLE